MSKLLTPVTIIIIIIIIVIIIAVQHFVKPQPFQFFDLVHSQ
jgi:hypothetical protein